MTLRVLLSVYDKTGLVEFARELAGLGCELIASGGTAAALAEANVPHVTVESVTEFPEMLGGRVKTLHPRIHGGILADRSKFEHRNELKTNGIEPIDLVVCNLYPFTSNPSIELIDVGGPTMVRAAAKNWAHVGSVVDPADYEAVLAELRTRGELSDELRRRLARKAFAHTAAYDAAIANWFAEEDGEQFPDSLNLSYQRSPGELRYGENWHQRSALYLLDGAHGGVVNAEPLHGKPMSHNNYVDTTAAWRAAHDHLAPCVAIIKHTNPCGIALGENVAEAHRRAHDCDPLSAFGGVIATNWPVSVQMAEQVAGIFTEVIAAPGYEDGALEVLTRKRDIRVLQVDPLVGAFGMELRFLDGGLLMQIADDLGEAGDLPPGWTLRSGEPGDDRTIEDLQFAWRCCRAVKSNAILLANDLATVGVGMGQVNRVDAAKLAVDRADARAKGSVAASDAFFPFADGLQVLIDAGVRAVVEPGGSNRDEEVIAAAQAVGLTLYFTGVRHFLH